MVEEADAAADPGASMTFQRKRDADFGFVGLAMNACASHAVTSRPSSSSQRDLLQRGNKPGGLRVAPDRDAHTAFATGIAERSRTRMPRCRMAITNSRCFRPMRTSRKLAWLGQL